jgi:hypothetical protein
MSATADKVTRPDYLEQQRIDREQREALRYRRDVEYKRALGLPLSQPLPNALGSAGSSAPHWSARSGRSIFRGTRRPA